MQKRKSELRQNLVSGDWILVSPVRGRRPDEFKEKSKRKKHPKSGCPFEFEKLEKDLYISSYPSEDDPRIKVIFNKYPAVTPSKKAVSRRMFRRLFPIVSGFGHHEMIITEDHDNNFPALDQLDAQLLLRLFQERYKEISRNRNTSYVSIFHNWGEKAGASIYHPHYQLISLPVVPHGVGSSLNGSRRYFKEHKRCVHCIQIAWEKKEKKRMVYENKHAVSFVPFASKEPFEMRVFPKTHLPFFEETPESTLHYIADALQSVLRKLEISLSEPDYNFFIHTAPVQDRNKYKHYHWHIEIFPRTNISAGFELGTDIEINPLDPNEAAKFLRSAK